MKEFIEKLVTRIMLESASCKVYKLINPNKEDIAEFNAYKKCIEIINELAVEYINTSTDTSTDTSSGWIACSERLPDIEGNTSDTVLVCTIDGFRHMAFWCADGKWRYCESGMIKNSMEWTVIIAWQPLPKPYKEGK